MPFRWTINPYRGCAHACTYCVGGQTKVLTADGRTVRMADIQVGDAIYGTVGEGAHRRFGLTRVLDKWSSIKPAYAVALEDGTELVASAEHRFLTARGWKHVMGAQGSLQRPHLTLSSKMIGPGGFVEAPAVDHEYRRGYLCGLIRGDGHIGAYSYERPGRGLSVDRFRLALTDTEALVRAGEYLSCFEVTTNEFSFAEALGNRRAVSAIRTSSGGNVERIAQLVRWPIMATVSWMKGFLGGIFDAEGSCGGQALAIANTDPEILKWVGLSMDRLGFEHVVERTSNPNGMTYIRLRGGLPERMRFLLGTDPAITRKRTIDGAPAKTNADLRVRSIRPLGKAMRMYDITTGTGDFIADGVVSHNCFARPTHKYLDFDAGRDFEREIVVKVNARRCCAPSWRAPHGSANTWRSGRTPTPTSGSRGATS
jgi:hypothetical protein